MSAQRSTGADFERSGAALRAQHADPQIAAALRDVSSAEVRKTVEAMVSFHNRNTVGSTANDLPEGTGVRAAAAWIHAHFESLSKECGGCLEVHEETFTAAVQEGPRARVLRPTPMLVEYAVLKGTDPAQSARRIAVTGHYDSYYTRDPQDIRNDAPGANDDASGTAVSLECARVLSKHRFPATLVFMAVPGEEQGLLGSRAMAQFARREGWQLEGVLNNDIVGGDTTPGQEALEDKHRVRVFSEGISLAAKPETVQKILTAGYESDSPSRELARAISDVGRTYTEAAPAAGTGATHAVSSTHTSGSTARAQEALRPVLIFRLDRYGRGGDHSSFNREGFAAVRFTEWRENFNHQHQPVHTEDGVQFGDLIQYDDFNYIARVARINAAALATLASAPAAPTGVSLSPASLENEAILSYTGQPAPGAHFEVLWRETSAPDWQFSAPASSFPAKAQGDVTTMSVPVSKDNVVFGIRACDANGHCSPATAPLPN